MNLIASIARSAGSLVVEGPTLRIRRLLRADLRNPVVAVTIDYTPMTYHRKQLLPWRKTEEGIVWVMTVKCRVTDGTVYSHEVYSIGNVQSALDYGYLKGLQATLQLLVAKTQADINEARG